MAVFGADAAEILLFVAQEFNAFDDDRVFEEFSFEYRLLENSVQFGVALLECARESVARCVEELGNGSARKDCSGASGKSCGNKGTAIELHRKVPCGKTAFMPD